MDKQFVAWTSVAIVGLIAMTDPQIANTLLSFIILGIIPGTENRIPDWAAYLAYATAGFILLIWLLSRTLYIGEISPVHAASKPVVKRTKKKPSRANYNRKRPVKRQSRAAV